MKQRIKMKKHLSTLLFLTAALLWGLAFSAQKDAGALPAFTIGAVRNIFATLFLLLAIPFLDKFRKTERHLIQKGKAPDFNKTEIIGGIICGAILTVATAFQQTGLGDGTDAGKAAFITALYVVIVPILTMFSGRLTPINVWISIAIAVVGFYLLCIKDNFTIVPSDALVLVCALIFSLHIIAIDRFSPRCDGVRMSCVQFFSAFVFNLIFALIFEGTIPFAEIINKLPSLLYLGICSSGIAYTLQIVGQGQYNANPSVASIVLSLESVFGVIGGALLLGEVMQPREYIGCAVVFVAVVLSQIEFKRKF